MNIQLRNSFLRCSHWLLAVAFGTIAASAFGAGSGARPDGPSIAGFGWFTTGGQLDLVYAGIDGGIFSSTGGAFTNIGAGIGGTSVQTFRAPSRDFVWAGSDTGVWVSFDRGRTWQARNNGLGCLNARRTVVSNTGTMYVATRCSDLDAVYRSFDSGLSWQALAALPGSPQINRMNPSADTTQSTVYALTTSGRFRTSDTTTGWTADQALSGSPYRNVPPGSNAIDSSLTTRSVCLMLVRNVGPYRTANCPIGGTSQPAATLQTQGLPTLTAFGVRISIVNNEQLIPVIGDGLYRFDGTRWVRAYSDAQVPGIEYVRDITPGSSTLLATSRTSGLWRSTDSGATWQPFGLAGSEPATTPQTLAPVTPPPQTSFAIPTGQMPSEAIVAVEASSDVRSLSVSVELDLARILRSTPSARFAVETGYSVYVVAAVPGERLGAAAGTRLFFQRPANGAWGTLTSPLAAFAENVALGAADQRVRVEILRSTDVSALRGTEFYIGYGTSDTEMLQAQRYRGVYIVE